MGEDESKRMPDDEGDMGSGDRGHGVLFDKHGQFDGVVVED